MTHPIRLSIGAAALAVLAACSSKPAQPALSDDLKQDLAKVGSSDVQLAGTSNGRIDVVSAAERTNGAVAAPKAPSVSRAPSTARGTRAPVRSVRHETPAAAEPTPRAEQPAPVELPRNDPRNEPVPAAGRPSAPRPSTQREPPGGWRTPGQVIRNAPFPINP
jgi:hypothetical protein